MGMAWGFAGLGKKKKDGVIQDLAENKRYRNVAQDKLSQEHMQGLKGGRGVLG